MKRLLAGMILLATSLMGPGAHAAGGEDTDRASGKPPSTFETTYDLFAGGLALGQVNMSARIQGQEYKIVSDLLTRGIVNRLWQATIQASSNGIIEPKRVHPSLYDSYTVNPRRKQQVTLTFDADGMAALHAEPAYDASQFPVSPEQKKETLDPLSGVLYVVSGMAVDDANPCGKAAPIFDGRRRYDVALSFVKKDAVRMENGIYAGPVLVCKVNYLPIAGFGQTLIRPGAKTPDIYVWVAQSPILADANRHYFVPLRLWADTDFGRIVALVSKLKIDGNNLKSTE